MKKHNIVYDKEIRWQNGKEEYSREIVEYMLGVQRAMIYNDIKYLLIQQAESVGLKGKFTPHGEQIMDSLRNCRKVEF